MAKSKSNKLSISNPASYRRWINRRSKSNNSKSVIYSTSDKPFRKIKLKDNSVRMIFKNGEEIVTYKIVI